MSYAIPVVSFPLDWISHPSLAGAYNTKSASHVLRDTLPFKRVRRLSRLVKAPPVRHSEIRTAQMLEATD